MEHKLVKTKPRTLDAVRDQFSGRQDARWRGLEPPLRDDEWQVYNRLDVIEAQLAMRDERSNRS